MDVRPYQPDQAEQWDRLVAESDSSVPGHDRRWPEVFASAFGHAPCSLVALDGGEVRGVLPLVEIRNLVVGRILVSLPWLDAAGACAPDESTAAALEAGAVELARARGARSLELRKLGGPGAGGSGLAHKVTLRLRLGEGEQRLWRGFDAKLRNQIRKSEKSGLTTQFGGAELVPQFYGPFSRNMRDLGVPVWGIDFYRTILKRFPGEAEMLVVRSEAEAIGGALLLHWRGVLLVPCASSLRTHFDKCPNHALYWAAIRRGIERGARLFDFGRSTVGTGTDRFKRSWGSEPIPCFWSRPLQKRGGAQAWSTSNPKLRLFVNTWRRLPVELTRIVGPHIVKRLP